MTKDAELLQETYDEAVQLVQEMGHEDFGHSLEIHRGHFKIVVDPKKKYKHHCSEIHPTICVEFTFPFYNVFDNDVIEHYAIKKHYYREAKDTFFNQLREAIRLCRKNV